MSFWRCLNEACRVIWFKNATGVCARCGMAGEDATANAKSNGRPKPEPPPRG